LLPILLDRNTITTDPVPAEWYEPVFASKKIIYHGQPIGIYQFCIIGAPFWLKRS
jgi:hypothetical protein